MVSQNITLREYTVVLPNLSYDPYVESLQGIGAITGLTFSIFAKDRRTAVRDLTDQLTEYYATHRGTDLPLEIVKRIDSMKIVR